MKINFIILIIIVMVSLMIFTGCDLDFGFNGLSVSDYEYVHELGDIHVMVDPGTHSFNCVHCIVTSNDGIESDNNIPWDGDHYCFKTKMKDGVYGISVDGYQNNQIAASADTSIYTSYNSTTTITIVLQ